MNNHGQYQLLGVRQYVFRVCFLAAMYGDGIEDSERHGIFFVFFFMFPSFGLYFAKFNMDFILCDLVRSKRRGLS